MNRKHIRILFWGALAVVFAVSLTISIGHWQGMLTLQPHALIWLVFLMIVLWEAGYWFGEERPQVVQLADLNAIRKSMDTIPELVERAVKREIANAYVDAVANGRPELRVVRDSGDRPT